MTAETTDRTLDQDLRDGRLAPASAFLNDLAPPEAAALLKQLPPKLSTIGFRLLSKGLALEVFDDLDADGVPANGAGLDLLAAAALAERATLCIGNDNALTHISAAIGAPTLTLERAARRRFIQSQKAECMKGKRRAAAPREKSR